MIDKIVEVIRLEMHRSANQVMSSDAYTKDDGIQKAAESLKAYIESESTIEDEVTEFLIQNSDMSAVECGDLGYSIQQAVLELVDLEEDVIGCYVYDVELFNPAQYNPDLVKEITNIMES